MPRSLLLNHVVLLLCCSIYLGTGVSLVFFQFPLEPLLTPDNYRLVFVEPVANATRLLTDVTIVMLVTEVVMLVTEWFSGIRWVPIVVLTCTVLATALTVLVLFRYNKALSDGISDAAELHRVFARWAAMNRLRVSLWCVQWAAMAYWFYSQARAARGNR